MTGVGVGSQRRTQNTLSGDFERASWWELLSPQEQQRVLALREQAKQRMTDAWKAMVSGAAGSVLLGNPEAQRAAQEAQRHYQEQYNKIRQAYQNWIGNIHRLAENAQITTTPAERLTLGGGGLFRNFAKQIRLGELPEFTPPSIEHKTFAPPQKPHLKVAVMAIDRGVPFPEMAEYYGQGKWYNFNELKDIVKQGGTVEVVPIPTKFTIHGIDTRDAGWRQNVEREIAQIQGAVQNFRRLVPEFKVHDVWYNPDPNTFLQLRTKGTPYNINFDFLNRAILGGGG